MAGSSLAQVTAVEAVSDDSVVLCGKVGSRECLVIHNASDETIFVKLGASIAAADDFSFAVLEATCVVISGWTGEAAAYCATGANGDIFVTECYG